MADVLARYLMSLRIARTEAEAWQALDVLAQDIVGHKLFTVTIVHLEQELVQRRYTNSPEAYPVSGTKPIVRDAWFEQVHAGLHAFRANSIAEIARVFPDHSLIQSLGCGSVINLPVVLGGELVATINLLDAEGAYPQAKGDAAESTLALPALASYFAVQCLTRDGVALSNG
jgi:hypothetical protein